MHNLKVNFLDFIPKTFFNLDEYEKEAKRKSNTNFLISPTTLFNDKSRFLLFYKKIIRKKKIFVQQHGSYYQDGRKEYKPLIRLEEDRVGKLIFWGKLEKKHICLPSPQIKRININYKSKKILFLSILNFYFSYYCDYFSNYTNSVKRINLTLDLLNFLKKNIREKIFYKNQNFHFNFSENELIRKKFQEINFINTQPEKFLKKVRLVILNNYSTMFFKCIGGNIPTILINNNFSDLNYKARKFFKRLEESNIIFRNAKEAANFINKNYDNIYNWWNKKSVQNSVKFFSYNYCYTKQNWFKYWYNFFKKNKFK